MSFTGMMLAGRPTINKVVVIASHKVDWVLVDEVFGGVAPLSKVSVKITINSGVNITSSSTSVAPMDLTGLPDQSTIRLINNGNVYGYGGKGGEGDDVFAETDE